MHLYFILFHDNYTFTNTKKTKFLTESWFLKLNK